MGKLIDPEPSLKFKNLNVVQYNSRTHALSVMRTEPRLYRAFLTNIKINLHAPEPVQLHTLPTLSVQPTSIKHHLGWGG